MKKTLKDEIAMAAMQSILTNEDLVKGCHNDARQDDTKSFLDVLTDLSYEFAEYMLAEKQRREQGE